MAFVPINSVINSIRLHDGGGGVLVGYTTLDIVFQCHGRCCVPCGGLGALDVFGDIVDVGEDRRAEAARLDGFGETRLLLDAGTHSPDLNVGQWLLPTQHKVVWESRQQVLFNLRHKGDGSLAGFGLRFAHHAEIAGWMRDRPLGVEGVNMASALVMFSTE